MTRPLRVMILEDSTADFGLVLHEVKQAGLAATCERASGHDEFTANNKRGNSPPNWPNSTNCCA
jgi:hypothetical protein